MPVRYAWKAGARFSGDPQKVGAELERIRIESNRQLTPEAVVDRARHEASPLHPHFTWDDAEAAELWRKEEAGELIRSVTVDVSRSNVEGAKLVRAFVSVEREGERSYTSTIHALSDVDLRAQVIASAWRELVALRRRYEGLEELAKVFAAIDEARPSE